MLGVRALVQRRTTVPDLVRHRARCSSCSCWRSAWWSARSSTTDSIRRAGHVLPQGSSLPALLGVAACAAVLANVINNLPAVLALLPIVAAGGSGPLLAMLIGVNIGPNLTYVGSLATLLWRRVLREHDSEPAVGEFARLGVLTVPAALVAAVVALWLMLAAIGG